MKKMKYIIHIVAVIAMVVTGCFFLGILFRPAKIDIVFSQIDTFHSLPEQSVDVLIYGSSHAWRTVKPMQMYEEYGIGAYNYASFWQKLNTTELFFYDSIETQKPKVVLIETKFINKIAHDNDFKGEIYYTKGISDSKYKRKYLEQCFSGSGLWKKLERYLIYYYPFIQYHSQWESISKESFHNDLMGENLFETMGYHNVEKYHGDAHCVVKFKKREATKQKKLSKASKKILNGIVKTCKEKGIEVIFFTAPASGGNVYSEALSKYAEKNQCEYIDFFQVAEDAGIDGETDFYDDSHLNDFGASKVTKYLADFLHDNYHLEDRRLEDDNIWKQAGAA